MAQGELVAPTDWGKGTITETPPVGRTEGELASDRFRSEQFQAQTASKSGDKADQGDAGRNDGKGPSITNHGLIKEMSLPLGWQEATARGDQSVLRSERIFRLKSAESGEEKRANLNNDDPGNNGAMVADRANESSAAQLVLFYSGRPNDSSDGQAFRNVLQAAPHKLSSDELKGLERTMGDLSDKDSFQLTEASTKEVNGKSVLDVKGVWLYNKNQYHGLLMDGDRTGKVVQQIYLMAPASEFSARNKDFEQACLSIKWR